MFDINASQVADAGMDLQRTTKEWGNRIQDVNNVERVLSEYSGMEQVLGRLRNVCEIMDMQQQRLAILAQATDKIVQKYAICESRIVNNGEGNVNIRYYTEIGHNNLFNSGNKINKISIRIS